MKTYHYSVLFSALALSWQSTDVAADPLSAHMMEQIIIKGRQTDLLGQASSASEGVIGNAEIRDRPLLRTGEILEFIPGMVVTQHSGSGKANQYFLRGFNLDHGTDFSTFVDGMPVNMRSHGHGQGYTDLSFILPELISQIDYQKGAYHANSGDFSAAGSARFSVQNRTANQVSLALGQDNYRRLVAKGSSQLGRGNVLAAAELQQYDGPWTDIDEDVDKLNGVLRYSQPLASGQLSVTAMAYNNSWNAADQIPARAVASGQIDRLGSLDTTVGGNSDRYSLSTNWYSDAWQANAYVITSEMDLWSNFTYFLTDSVNGDQFEQVDNRRIYGGQLSRHWHHRLGQFALEHVAGVALRYDDIDEVGLYNTRLRQRLNTVRSDRITQGSVGLYSQSDIQLTADWTAHLGLRYDYMDVAVNSALTTANSGDASDDILSLKAGISYQFAPNWQGYINAGQGFHSNDARGATTVADPVTLARIAPVDLLVKSNGAELGLRFFDYTSFNASVALWYLQVDSELLYVGDAGNNEPSRSTERYGVELAAYYWLGSNWSLDVELAFTRSRFTEQEEGEGNFVDGSLPLVASMGLIYKADNSWQASLRLRHFGKRTLDSFNEQRSDTTTVLNAGYQYDWQQWQLALDLLNILDSTDNDIDYFYASRLQGEPAEGEEDRHSHPIEPRTIRAKLTYRF
ncbi:TonB-dependent receptor [Arsukibacterium sp. MJ3]|jgi:outer membrane receptor protein involved in Fe transport|uniref:TonB-dependent receptor n=1 Tax=Arsukibacterium sp. MJ3 TaxID=1632859 RepID=UPI0006273E3C|nr:TonB-dependent receptor [Arsukibacterium sp. MJ3]KKO49988.1 TonB-dependent receptor [Arsukibacterium sp. MJ3]